MSVRREIIPKLSILESQEDMEADKLDRILNDGFDLGDIDVTKRALIRKVKQVHADYEGISGRLVKRYADMASIAKAEEIRTSRRRRRTDVHDFVRNLRASLSQGDDISSVDLNSVKSARVQDFINASAKDTLPPTGNGFEQIADAPEPTGEAVGLTCVPSSDCGLSQGVHNINNLDPLGKTDWATIYSSGNRDGGVKRKITVNEQKNSGVLLGADMGTSHYPRRNLHLKRNQSIRRPFDGFTNDELNPGQGRSTRWPTSTYASGVGKMGGYWSSGSDGAGVGDHGQQFNDGYSLPGRPTQGFAHDRRQHMTSCVQNSLINELNKLTISPFNGKPSGFWSWRGRITQKLESAPLSALQKLLLLQENCSGPPRRMIEDHLHARGEITEDDVEEIWSLLEERYGSHGKIAEELFSRLERFPSIREGDVGQQLLELYDLCKIVNFNLKSNLSLQHLNTAGGLKLIRFKLPEKIQEDWRRYGQDYKMSHSGQHPPFDVFAGFLRRVANTWSDGDFSVCAFRREKGGRDLGDWSGRTERVMKTATADLELEARVEKQEVHCPLHDRSGHELNSCHAFRRLPFDERRAKLAEWKRCFKCLGEHFASNCRAVVRCDDCHEPHATGMHIDRDISSKRALCTALCSDSSAQRNCSKTVLVDLTMKDVPGKSMRVYAILDEHSNISLVDERVIDFFGKRFPERDYTLNFASQRFQVSESGYLVTGLAVSSAMGGEVISLPNLLSTKEIADTKNEVADPAIVEAHSHIRHLARNFPPIDPDASVMILIGRDCGRAMRCESFSHQEPFAYETPLGWALVGRTCVDGCGRENRVMRTCLSQPLHVNTKLSLHTSKLTLKSDPFVRYPDDEESGMSVEDKLFLDTLRARVRIDCRGSVELPIPLKHHETLPDNRLAVKYRTYNTIKRLMREPEHLRSCLEAMGTDLFAGFVEEVPETELSLSSSTWFLPVFSVNSKNKTRLVFDASAKYKGISLNDIMLQGPDMNNSLRGVLLRFREKPVGFMTDVSQMFKAFVLPEEQRDLYRFYWFKNNDPSRELVQHRSTVHLFGSRSSPAIATFGLKYAARYHAENQCQEVVSFIENNFYVDDGISSASSAEEAVAIITGAKRTLARFNIKLHKILCSSEEVLKHFPTTEIAHGSHSLETKDGFTTRTLGVAWEPKEDCFSITLEIPDRPFTKRGILAVINSLFDPLGIISPVVLSGRLILRAVLPNKNSPEYIHQLGWDEVLPEHHLQDWKSWLKSLDRISDLKVPRCFVPRGFNLRNQELHVYCDASEQAIGHVIYVRSTDDKGGVHVGLVEANSKVAPRTAATIPRLELCGAVEACVAAARVTLELSRTLDATHYYTDSKIVLGYLSNHQARYNRYVSRRIELVHQYSGTDDWHHVPTGLNPADLASRPATPDDLISTCWVRGPAELWESCYKPPVTSNKLYTGILPETLPEVVVLRTGVGESSIFALLLNKISSLHLIVNVVAILMRLYHKLDLVRQRLGVSSAPRRLDYTYRMCLNLLICESQRDGFSPELATLNKGYSLPGSSNIACLAPFLDGCGLIRVGGRIRNANLCRPLCHPILLHPGHKLTDVMLRQIHEDNNHQGRVVTHAAVRQAGYHVQRGSKILKRLIDKCVVCRRMRGELAEQQMADLPLDRLETIAPFSNIGMDAFGPFHTFDTAMGTRTRGSATKKIWVLIIVCLVSRAVHLEMLVSMDASAFMNAFRRFQAIRGCAKLIRTDRGTNFLCVRTGSEPKNLAEIIRALQDQQGDWKLHPPYASHFAGSWERKIRSVRSVLEGSLQCLHQRHVPRDEFATLLQEASAIVNNTPLTALSSSPEDLAPITPAQLLTLKDCPNPPLLDNFTEKDLDLYGRKRWRRVQVLADEFWHRWRTEYVSTLQERRKWKRPRRNIEAGDIVIVKERAPRNIWPLARVEAVKTSGDSLVRSVVLRLPALPGKSKPRYTTRCIHDVVFLFHPEEPTVEAGVSRS